MTQSKCNLILDKKGEPTCRLLHEFFEISRNPFVSVLQAIVHCRGFHLGNKQNSLPCTVMEEFSSWSQKKHSNLSHLLKTDIKLLAFDVAVQQKNETLRKLIVQTYQMNMDKQLFVFPILTLVQEGKYKEVRLNLSHSYYYFLFVCCSKIL